MYAANRALRQLRWGPSAVPMNAKLTTVCGYLSLALTALLFAVALIPVRTELQPIPMVLGFIILINAIRLGIAGIQVGRGMCRISAGLSLSVLFVWAIAAVVATGISLSQLVAGSGSR